MCAARERHHDGLGANARIRYDFRARWKLKLECVEIDPQRSALMKRVKQKNTAPEIVLRKLLHSRGYRFRLHRKDLPGKPDICFPSRRKVIFVNGCFWHGHENCRAGRLPKTRTDFWAQKITANRARDASKISLLDKANWSSITVWECELKEPGGLVERLDKFLQRTEPGSGNSI